MNMKKFFLSAAMLVSCCLSASAQKTSAEFLSRYNMLVKNLGPAGVGIENLLNKWEASFPDDVDMLSARFVYYFSKSQSSQVVAKSQQKFMGSKPIVTLKDSLGNQTHYFEEIFYEDSLYACSMKAIEKAIRLNPDRLDLRFEKLTSLLSYEKESPDMLLSSMKGLIDYNFSVHPKWKYGTADVSSEEFSSLVQDVCGNLYLIASASSYSAFRTISEKMLDYEPKNVLFLNNLGTYELVVNKDDKKALKYYNKVLKISKNDYSAAKNCVIIARREKNIKLERKYLAIVAGSSPDEGERLSSKARLEHLSSKK